MKKMILALLCVSGFAANAGLTVDTKTCAQAQAYVAKHGRYYLNAGQDGAIPIYPIYTKDTIKCTGRSLVTQEVVSTSDNPHCSIGFYCLSY